MTSGEPYYEPQGTANVPPEYHQDDMETDTSTTQQLTDKAKQGANQVKQSASAATDQLKQSAVSQAFSQKAQAAQSLNTVSDAVNQAAQQLRQNHQEPIAHVAETAAYGINQLADHLNSRSVNDLIGEAEDFASRQPALFLGGAFLLGVLGARFLKSSREGMSQPRGSQNWRGQQSGYLRQTNQYGAQYGSYSGLNTPPGVGQNVNTGGLAYGRNLPNTNATGGRRPDGTYESYPTDDNIIEGDPLR